MAWDDVNSNGIQDEGELGIEGVEMQLIKDSNRTPFTEDTGGNCHRKQKTNAEGFVTFTMIPQSEKFRFQLVDVPTGAQVAPRRRGEDRAKDSDFHDSLITDSFSMADSDIKHNIDVGFKMPTVVSIEGPALTPCYFNDSHLYHSR